MDQVGCTVCHEGMGQSVSFRDASHTPSTKSRRSKWEEEFDWEEPHLWDYPMLPAKSTEASCAKCHKQEVYIPGAENLNVAYATYERAGCYACHKTQGIREPAQARTDPDEDRLEADARLGEDLDPQPEGGEADDLDAAHLVQLELELAGRLDPERSRDQRGRRLSLCQQREARFRGQEPAARRCEGRPGDRHVDRLSRLPRPAEKERTAAGPHRTFGQPLENIGNKTTYEWIYNWVRDPKHYNPATFMPNLRLTDAQVADVATFLSTLKDQVAIRPRPRRIRQRSTRCCSTT